MTKKAKKLSKKLWAIISAVIVVVISLAIIITNIFIPVKYLSSYCVSGKRAKAGTMRVTFVDVGYGDCIIVELPDGKNMLIDAGNGKYSNNLKVLKELNRRDIDTIDYLICSSVNGEHCGGLDEVIKYKKVKSVYMPYCTNKYVTEEFKSFVGQVEKENLIPVYNEYGTGISADGYFFTFLSPTVKEYSGGAYAQLNLNPTKENRDNSSAVLWLEYGDTAIVFTSDVEESVLSSLVSSIQTENYAVNIDKCKIVQIACHGSYNSDCSAFYDFLNPEAAIVSVGENGAGCPSAEIIDDITGMGSRIYRTDESGNIVIEMTAAGYTFK